MYSTLHGDNYTHRGCKDVDTAQQCSLTGADTHDSFSCTFSPDSITVVLCRVLEVRF